MFECNSFYNVSISGVFSSVKCHVLAAGTEAILQVAVEDEYALQSGQFR